MKRNKVLVFPCGSEIGLEINSALKWSTYITLFGGSSAKLNHGKFVYKNYFDNFPQYYSNSFIPYLNRFIDKHKIYYVFPSNDDVGLILSKNKNNLNCELLYSPYQTAKICRSKSETYNKFFKILAVPIIYKQKDKLKFPLFLKPEKGQGSEETFKVNSKKELSFILKNHKNLLILEHLPGKEYTIDCFTDENRKLLVAKARVRARIAKGISVNTYPINGKRFLELAQKINSILIFKGAWFFQVKERRTKELVLMEIAPRIAGSMALYRAVGINFPLLTI